MPIRNPFRLNRSGVLLALVSAAFAGEAGAAAGRVDFAIGGATVSGTDGRERPLTKGSELDSGDTIRTNDGRAQIRFTDGAYVSLQPNTDFSIKEYSFGGKADGSERGFFGLAKGAMRAVTGLIGRVNRSRYAITTPTATVGIRGTGGLIAVNPDGSTSITGTSGIWTLTNRAGTLDVPAGTIGFAPSNPSEPPKQADQPPSVGPVQPAEPPVFKQAEDRKSDGTISSIQQPPAIVPLASGSGYSAVVATSGFSGSSATTDSGTLPAEATAVFDLSGRLTSVTFANSNSLGGPTSYKLDGGSHAPKPESDTDGILAWGRWTGSVSLTSNACEGACPPQTLNFSDRQGLHYVIGMPTPVMPTSGTGVAYALLGATHPTLVSGTQDPGTFKLNSLTVNFGPTASVALNFDVSVGGFAYRVDAPGTASSAQILFSPSTSGRNGSSCVQGCFAGVQGFFAGASAERIGIGYQVSDSFASANIVGAAAFKKQ